MAPGAFVALLGRSGSGKTTLLRTLAGLDPAPAEADIQVPTSTTVVFQEPRLLPWKPVWENVALGLSGEGAPPAGPRRRWPRWGLTHRKDAWPGYALGRRGAAGGLGARAW